MPSLSVIICTHNPRPDYLARTLTALRAQTLPTDRWELLLIDNASTTPLDPAMFGPGLGWHPNARCVREDEIGLTPARLRGISEVHGDLISLVDDDNLLASDYLETAVRIGAEHPHLGAWGSARLLPEYEVEPEPGLAPWLQALALWDLPYDYWANFRFPNRSVPCGAGMCLRREVAVHWAEQSAGHPLRRNLDRKGKSLVSMGDIDLALTACDLGMGTGIFRSLVLTHLISARRVSRDYLLELFQAGQLSEVLLKSARGLEIGGTSERFKLWIKLAFLRGLPRRFLWSLIRGQAQGRRMVRDTARATPVSKNPPPKNPVSRP